MAKDNRIARYSPTKPKLSPPNLPTYSPLNALTNTALSYPLKKGFTSIVILTKTLRNGNDKGKNQRIDSSDNHKSNASKDNSDNSKTTLSYNSSPTLHSRLNIVTSSIIKSIQEGDKYNLQKQNSLDLTKCYQGICNILLGAALTIFRVHTKDHHLLPTKILLSVGANPNIKILWDEDRILYYEILTNRPNIVKLLCQYHADVNFEANNKPLIIDIIQRKKWDIVKILLDNGANVAVCDNEGLTPLHYSVIRGNTECAQWLIEKGADVNACDNEDRTPLYHIVFHQNTNCAKLLIKKGAVVNARDNKGHTPLYYVVSHGNTNCAKLLIEKGADIKLLDNNVIILAAKKGYWNAVKLLIEQGAPLDGHDENHNNLMLLAVQSSKTEVVKLLFNAAYSSSNDKKLSYHEFNKKGVTPLFAAIQLGNLEMVELIVQNDNTIPPEYLTKCAETLDMHPAVQMFGSLKKTIHRRGHTKSASNINTKDAVQEGKEEDLKDAYQNSDINFDVTAEESKSSEEPTVSGDTSSDTSEDL